MRHTATSCFPSTRAGEAGGARRLNSGKTRGGGDSSGFQINTGSWRLDFLLAEEFAHRSLYQIGKTVRSEGRPILACMACQQPRRPQLVRITVRPAHHKRSLDAAFSHRGEGPVPEPIPALRVAVLAAAISYAKSMS